MKEEIAIPGTKIENAANIKDRADKTFWLPGNLSNPFKKLV